MPIIDQLRQDINQAIDVYVATNKPDMHTLQSTIDDLRGLLQSNNPLKVRNRLSLYIDNLSTGIRAYWPFLEINRFKRAMRHSLDASKYQEVFILKSMVTEAGIRLHHDHIDTPDGNVLARIERLEMALSSQHQELHGLTHEIKRLKNENVFMTKTIAMLSQQNKHLAQEKVALKDELEVALERNKALVEQLNQTLNENESLHAKLATYTSSLVPPEKRSQEGLPFFKHATRYSTLSHSQTTNDQVETNTKRWFSFSERLSVKG